MGLPRPPGRALVVSTSPYLVGRRKGAIRRRASSFVATSAHVRRGERNVVVPPLRRYYPRMLDGGTTWLRHFQLSCTIGMRVRICTGGQQLQCSDE